MEHRPGVDGAQRLPRSTCSSFFKWTGSGAFYGQAEDGAEFRPARSVSLKRAKI